MRRSDKSRVMVTGKPSYADMISIKEKYIQAKVFKLLPFNYFLMLERTEAIFLLEGVNISQYVVPSIIH